MGRNNGAHIYAWNRKNGTNQRWSLSNIGGGRYMIRSQHSKKCLDNTGTARVNRHYHQWDCKKRNANQHFYIKHLIRNANISRGWKMIKGRGNFCIGYNGRHGYVRNRRCDNTNKVMWQFIKYAGRYIIRNKSGYVLRIYSSYITAWTRQNNTAQRWLMQSIGGGKYLIKNQKSKKCIHSRKMRKYNQLFNHYNCNTRNQAQQYSIVNAKAKSRKLKIKKNNRRSRVPKKGPKVGPKGKGPKKGPKVGPKGKGPKGKGPKGKGPKVGPKGKGPKGKGPKGPKGKGP